MFSYLAAEKLYLVATRNISVLVKDADELSKKSASCSFNH